MDFRLDKGTGYMYSYQPKHPCANSAYRILLHLKSCFLNVLRDDLGGATPSLYDEELFLLDCEMVIGGNPS